MSERTARRGVRPELKLLVAEASLALARLDAARLEELAQSCAALNRELTPPRPADRVELRREASDAAENMAVFARVLEATRENIRVMNRLRELRMGRLEYGPLQPAGRWSAGPVSGGIGHGNN